MRPQCALEFGERRRIFLGGSDAEMQRMLEFPVQLARGECHHSLSADPRRDPPQHGADPGEGRRLDRFRCVFGNRDDRARRQEQRRLVVDLAGLKLDGDLVQIRLQPFAGSIDQLGDAGLLIGREDLVEDEV